MTASRRGLLFKAALAGVFGPSFLRSAAAVEYSYDVSGRLTGVEYDNGSTVTYTYDDAGNRTQVVRAGPAAPSGAFTATPATISPSGSSTLSWTSATATSASINNGVGAVTPVAGGSVSVSPTATTTYTLTLTGPGGTTTKQASITVSAAPTGTFAASPSSISVGGSSTLSWTSAGATSASISNGVGAVTPVAGGSVSVSPTETTTYTLTLTGPGGTTTKQATVTVNVAPTGTFTANPTSIASGGSSTLSWTSANATSASINNGVGAVAPVAGGSVSVSPTATTTYTLTLTGPGGTTTKQATIMVGVDQTPDPRDWPDLHPTWNGTPTGSPTPDWADSPVYTIAGLGAGASITLSFSQDSVNAGAAGLQVQVFKNGAYATRSLSVPDATGASAGPVGPTVSVANGDTIRFRAFVFDSAIPIGSGLWSWRSARQIVTNQTTGAVFDAFTVGGSYSEQDGSCPPLQICPE